MIRRLLLCCLASLPLASGLRADEPRMTEVITFDVAPGRLFMTLDDVAAVFGWTPLWDVRSRLLQLNGNVIPAAECRSTPSGTELVSTDGLAEAGVAVARHPSGQSATLTWQDRTLNLLRADKRVEIRLGEQRLRAWQGDRLVLETKVSTGRRGNTPAGSFRAGPYKARMHRSSRYHNAPMPWSVQINGHIFIHGFTSVPDYPASHGCVRVPLNNGNPARFFYEWVDRGTPVVVLPVERKQKTPAATARSEAMRRAGGS